MTGLSVEPSLNRSFCPIQNLAKGERLVISAIRRWLYDKGNLPLIARRFHNDLGYGPGHLAMEGFCGVVDLLTNNARRTVLLRFPSSTNVSTDERTLIALIAAAQHNNEHHVAALTRWMFPPASQNLAIAHISVLAFALQDGGCFFARPTARTPHPETFAAPLKAVV